jgi:hypothetical protein
MMKSKFVTGAVSTVSGFLLCVGLLVGLTTGRAFGQATSSSSISGVVKDQQGASIPGTDVKLIDPSTNTTLSASANEAGRYIFLNITSGKYAMTFTKSGFNTFRVDDVEVEVGAVLTINATLQIGATTTTVEVTATSGAELQTTNASVGTTLTTSQLESLPNMGRDVSTLAVLQPGSTMTGNVAGAVGDQNTYTLDGGNVSDDMAGNTTGYNTNFTGFGGTQTSGVPSGVVPTPVESIEEVKVSTFGQTADFNNSSGGNIQMATKRGNNQFHGSGYGYYFATNLGAANSWTADHTPATVNGVSYQYTPIVKNHRARFGASLGGPLTPKPVLGGKWYFFFNYEASRFPNVGSYEHLVPSLAMRAGVIQIANAAGTYIPYNMTNSAVTLAGVNGGQPIAPAVCANGSFCDPRGLGFNPVISQLWNKFEPPPNDPNYSGGDAYNTQGYLSTIRAPLNTNNYVTRIDHDFNDKWRWMTSYRYMRLSNLTTNQTDIGGAFSGDTFGQPAAVAPRPQLPSYFVTGLTTNISANVTNNLTYNYLRNFWQWGDQNSPPQFPGLGGALEIGGESSTADLIPYNVNTQSTRQRFWDGHDNLLKDDVTMIKGNHLFQFGGTWAHNWDYHTRTDNGNGINNQIVYQITNAGVNFSNGTGAINTPYVPAAVPSSQLSTYSQFYTYVMGIVDQPQVAYTRSGANLTLNPVGASAYDKSVIDYYTTYFGDTWHMKPNFTLNYSLGYTIEMPPYEQNGKQVTAVDQSGQPINALTYLAQKQAAALQGQAYDPVIGFATVRNIGTGLKYPYNPYYGEWSPRVSAAWNPRYADGLLGKIMGDGKTVLRGGYGRIWGRVNGVAQVLSPLLGPGLIQAVSCTGASSTGQCLGAGNVDPTNAFRIGADGLTAPLPVPSQTLAQPYYPGVNGATAVGDVSALDPAFKPERTDNFNFTIQRQINRQMTVEVGYAGRIIKNLDTEINLDTVPYMMTLGNQQFAQAYANVYTALANNGGNVPANLAVQPFFEAALGGASSAYCKAFTSCTAAVANDNKSLFAATAVSQIWAQMGASPSWVLGRTMISSPACAAGITLPTCANFTNLQATSVGLNGPYGHGNYNSLFATYRAREYHGATVISNFTWARSLGTSPQSQSSSGVTVQDPFDIHAGYGPNGFDVRFTFNVAMSYATPWYKTQKGVVGHVVGGWVVAPLFFAESGFPIGVSYSESGCTACQAFGEVTPTASVSSVTEDAVFASTYTGGNSAHYGVVGTSGIATNNPYGLNQFSNPTTVYNEFRRCVLGIDTSCGGYGNIRGLPTWNLDATVGKNIGVWKDGRVGANLSFAFTNILNHFQPGAASLSLTSPTLFGRITTQGNTPRNLEFGLRIHF